MIFNGHLDGSIPQFHHQASQIDLNPTISIGSTTYTNVQDILEELAANTSGGFVTVGGSAYDVFSTGVLDSPDSKPPINDDFTSIFTDPLDPRYAKVLNGGCIVVLPGIYKVDATIQIPSGISLCGQMYNSTFVNQTSPQAPLFRIMADTNRTTDLAINLDRDVIFTKETKIFNLIISDNYLLPIIGGDTTYKDAKNTTQPLITIDRGANCSIDNVKFLGRTIGGTTLRAIDATQSTGSLTGTHIKIENCYFDGFQNIMRLRSASDTAGSRKDYFVISNNKMRAYGDGTYVDYETNSFISMNEANGTIVNNYMYLNDPLMLAGIYIDTFTTDVLTSSYTRMVISGNSGVIQKAAVDINANNIPFIKFSADGDKTSISAIGNNWGTDISSWYITIAGQNSKYIGDFNGSNSLDVALAFAQATTNDSNISTIYLYPGDYKVDGTITSLDQNKARLIGIRNGNQMPAVSVNSNNTLAVASTSFPSRRRSFLLANELRSIYFIINNTGISSPNVDYYANVIVNNGSTGFSSEDYSIVIDDCTFFNVCLVVPKKESTSGNNGANVKVTNCNFYLDGSKNHDAACLLPAGLNVVVENCNFNVDSSAFLNIGYESTDYSPSGINSNFYYNSNIKLNNNTFNLTDTSFNIDDTTAVGLYFQAVANYSLFNINSAANLFVENNRFFDGQLNNAYSATITDLTNLGLYRPAHIKMQAKNLFMNQNVFACSKDESYTNISGATYALPLLYLDINRSIFIDKCSFLGWKLQMLVSGDSLNESQNERVSSNVSPHKNCFSLTNSEFNQGAVDDLYYNMNFILFDLKSTNTTYDAAYLYENSFGSININNCKFTNYQSLYDGVSPPPIVISSLGGLQFNLFNDATPIVFNALIFNRSQLFDTNINNCVFDINMFPFLDDSPITLNYYIIYFDGSDGPTASKQNTWFTCVNNKISVINNIDTPVANEVSIFKINKGHSKISDNFLSIKNVAVSVLGKLCWAIISPDAITLSTLFINNNMFKRNLTDLNYAGIDLTDMTTNQYTRVYIIDNIFDDSYIAGASTTAFLLIRYDLFSNTNFVIDRNANYIQTKEIPAIEWKNYGQLNPTNKIVVLDDPYTIGTIGTNFWNTLYSRTSALASFGGLGGANKSTVTNVTDIANLLDETDGLNSFVWIVPVELPTSASITKVEVGYRLKNINPGVGTDDVKIGAVLTSDIGIIDQVNQIAQTSWIETTVAVPQAGATTIISSISSTYTLGSARIKYTPTGSYGLNNNTWAKYYVLVGASSLVANIYISLQECRVTYTY